MSAPKSRRLSRHRKPGRCSERYSKTNPWHAGNISTIAEACPKQYEEVLLDLNSNQSLIFTLHFIGFEHVPHEQLARLLLRRDPFKSKGKPPSGKIWKCFVCRNDDEDDPNDTPPIGALKPHEIGFLLKTEARAVRTVIDRIKKKFLVANMAYPLPTIDRRGWGRQTEDNLDYLFDAMDRLDVFVALIPKPDPLREMFEQERQLLSVPKPPAELKAILRAGGILPRIRCAYPKTFRDFKSIPRHHSGRSPRR